MAKKYPTIISKFFFLIFSFSVFLLKSQYISSDMNVPLSNPSTGTVITERDLLFNLLRNNPQFTGTQNLAKAADKNTAYSEVLQVALKNGIQSGINNGLNSAISHTISKAILELFSLSPDSMIRLRIHELGLLMEKALYRTTPMTSADLKHINDLLMNLLNSYLQQTPLDFAKERRAINIEQKSFSGLEGINAETEDVFWNFQQKCLINILSFDYQQIQSWINCYQPKESSNIVHQSLVKVSNVLSLKNNGFILVNLEQIRDQIELLISTIQRAKSAQDLKDKRNEIKQLCESITSIFQEIASAIEPQQNNKMSGAQSFQRAGQINGLGAGMNMLLGNG